eukprot:CAMPEP_0205811598 /NCGR_PEP_ID=MMETSP0205-20121125/15832_1 /ASSEMBLY_ACC=CAM_ASM_000278 /TAXON_ID=36767 /ORGANISM="Euplotes focardii, Strain TN1" /LENGTH=136 /DNA_ID=CAMNT_0053090997 /DNA_START=127 /DNA_END=534 /DNA_ORIENTATION=+
MSKDLVDMLKENQRRVEEDNKYLKQHIDIQHKNSLEKELIWSQELNQLKHTFETKLGIEVNRSQMDSQEWEDNSRTMKRNSPSHESPLLTPKKDDKENVVNQTNTMGRSDYYTLNHPDSVSSRQSHNSNTSKQAFE